MMTTTILRCQTTHRLHPIMQHHRLTRDWHPTLRPSATHGHLPIPRHLVQLAWMLDSVLQQVDPVMHPEVAQLHQHMATGTLRDLSSLNMQELSDLGTLLSITAHRLARQADPNTPAHEVALPPMSDEGL